MQNIENFANEIFYEIFDYLDCYEIDRAFANLNNRFQRLVFNYPLKLDYASQSNFDFQQLNQINRRKIISLSFYKRSDVKLFFTLHKFDTSFNHLQSLKFNDVSSKMLISILKLLKNLSHLYSLTIDLDDDMDFLKSIYELIFHLPVLKYLKLTLQLNDHLDMLSFRTQSIISPIEYLIIDYPSTLNELLAILSYTPKLSYLNCASLYECETIHRDNLSIELPNLSKIILKECYLSFDELKFFISSTILF